MSFSELKTTSKEAKFEQAKNTIAKNCCNITIILHHLAYALVRMYFLIVALFTIHNTNKITPAAKKVKGEG